MFHSLGRRIDNLTKTLDDARHISWDIIRHRANDAEAITATNKKRITEYERVLLLVNDYNTTALDNLHDAKEKLHGAKTHLLNIHDDYTVSVFVFSTKLVGDSPATGRWWVTSGAYVTRDTVVIGVRVDLLRVVIWGGGRNTTWLEGPVPEIQSLCLRLKTGTKNF